jgi:glycosyltransferase involved in cell wall biosynthesis
MKVSVIIPAHNEEHYIADTLDAVLAQNYRDFEVIVVDNASTDATSTIVAQYPNARYFFEPRLGSQYARECGRRHAHGDIIANLDADSIPDTDWITKALKYFNTSKVVGVGGSVDYFDGSRTLRTFLYGVQRFVYPPFHILFQTLRMGAVMLAANVFIKASALQAIGGYDTSITFYGDDTDTAKRLISIGKMVYKPSLCIKSSARRFNTHGIIKTFYLYLFSFFWIIFVRNAQGKIRLRAKALFSNRLK